MKGNCNRGDKCDFLHELPEENVDVVESDIVLENESSSVDNSMPDNTLTSVVKSSDVLENESSTTISKETIRKKFCRNIKEKGTCPFGDKCRFSHIRVICKHFLKGNCNRGDKCDFLHKLPEENVDVVESSAALENESFSISNVNVDNSMPDIEQPSVVESSTTSVSNETIRKKFCRNIKEKGTCPFGDRCNFSHTRIMCKHFLEGKCNRERCDFSHESPEKEVLSDNTTDSKYITRKVRQDVYWLEVVFSASSSSTTCTSKNKVSQSTSSENEFNSKEKLFWERFISRNSHLDPEDQDTKKLFKKMLSSIKKN